jgi:hypothetical protein
MYFIARRFGVFAHVFCLSSSFLVVGEPEFEYRSKDPFKQNAVPYIRIGHEHSQFVIRWRTI